jgi:hypothetical protein
VALAPFTGATPDDYDRGVNAVAKRIAVLLGACLAGAGTAVVIAVTSASAVAPGGITITIGNMTNAAAPTQNPCPSAPTICTYVPFDAAGVPELQVPAAGNVIGYSVGSGSGSDPIGLRVLRPAGGAAFLAVASSNPPTQMTSAGSASFSLATPIPVQAGDVIALDVGSSGIVLGASGTSSSTEYYDPAIANGTTGTPNQNMAGYELQMTATIVLNQVTTPINSTATVTQTVTQTISAPAISSFKQSHSTWAEGTKLASSTKTKKPPVGTTFSYRLSEPASVTFTFVQQQSGRVVHGKCKTASKDNANDPPCTIRTTRWTHTVSAQSGTNTLSFDGATTSSRKRVPAGSYTVTLQARSSAGLLSSSQQLSFTIAS